MTETAILIALIIGFAAGFLLGRVPVQSRKIYSRHQPVGYGGPRGTPPNQATGDTQILSDSNSPRPVSADDFILLAEPPTRRSPARPTTDVPMRKGG